MMHQSQFHIGLDFWCGGKSWRCTDVGSRVIVAIPLEPHEVVSIEVDPEDPLTRTKHHDMTDDPGWLNGPPYAIVEHVFDEDSVFACSLVREDGGQLYSLDALFALVQQSDVDIEAYFRELHHFSQHPPFKTRPSSFQGFSDYCRAQPTGIEPGGENEQTSQRTYAFVQFLRLHTPQDSLALAWKLFPLANVRTSEAKDNAG